VVKRGIQPYRGDHPGGVSQGVETLEEPLAVGAAQQGRPDDDQRPLRLLHLLCEGVLAAHHLLDGLGGQAKRLHGVGEVRVRPNRRHVRSARDVGAAEAGVEHGSLGARVRTHEEHQVGILHAREQGWHFSPRHFAVKTHSIDDSQHGPWN
jgi:hypothetical protein